MVDVLKGKLVPGVATRSSLSPADIHVLLVEDERLSRTVVASLLKKCSYKGMLAGYFAFSSTFKDVTPYHYSIIAVTTAENGAEAMALLQSNAPNTFQLVLTDVCMPEVNGIQLLNFVKADESLRSVPVVMMSAIEQGETVFECIRSGAEEYLVKPVTRKEVLHVWQHVLKAEASGTAAVPQHRTGGGTQQSSTISHNENITAHMNAMPPSSNEVRSEVKEVRPDYDAALHFLDFLKEDRLQCMSNIMHQMNVIDRDMQLITNENLECNDVIDGSKRQKKRKASSEGDNSGVRQHGTPAMPLQTKLHASMPQLEDVFFKRRSSSVDRSGLESFAGDLKILSKKKEFKEVLTLRGGEMASSQEMVCCADFDADDEHFATVSVSRSAKVYRFSDIVNNEMMAEGGFCSLMHYPVWQVSTRSKMSGVSWNSYVRSHLLTSDYDGLLQLWDVNGGTTEIASFEEHSKRVWAVDFSRTSPMQFASASDDHTVRVWNVNSDRSLARIAAPSNICSIHFSPINSHFLAAGCANHRAYVYDLRNSSSPLFTAKGADGAVSYVKFMGAQRIVAASTDSTVRLWNLENNTVPECCFTGHRNERNFVGLSVNEEGYIACGSEDNTVYTYYKSLPFALTSHSLGEPDRFVSTVCWARHKRQYCLVGNSRGNVSVLKLTS